MGAILDLPCIEQFDVEFTTVFSHQGQGDQLRRNR